MWYQGFIFQKKLQKVKRAIKPVVTLLYSVGIVFATYFAWEFIMQG